MRGRDVAQQQRKAVRHGLVLLKHHRHAVGLELARQELALPGQDLPAGAHVDGRRALPAPRHDERRQRVRQQVVVDVDVLARRLGRPDVARRDGQLADGLGLGQEVVRRRRGHLPRWRALRDVEPRRVDGHACGQRHLTQLAVPQDRSVLVPEFHEQLE